MDKLQKYKKTVTSQWGEDGIILEIFNRIGTTNKTCIEFGAGPGINGSNVWNLIENLSWKGLLIDPEKSTIAQWQEVISNQDIKLLNQFVEISGKNSIDQILKDIDFPADPDLLSIDIDGNDYHIFKSLQGRPRVILIEYNPTIPPHLEIIQTPEETDSYGASAKSIVKLAHDKRYRLAAITTTNCLFVREEDFSKLEVEEPSLESIFDPSCLTYLISTYKGSNFLQGISEQPSYSWFYDIYNVNLTKKIFHSISIGLSVNKTYSKVLSERLTPVKIFINKENQNFGVLRFAIKTLSLLVSTIKNSLYKPPLTKVTLKIRRLVKKLIPKALTRKIRGKEAIIKWHINGKPVPPPDLIKQKKVRKTGEEHGLRVLIETGTSGGDMIMAVKNNFDKIISIELGRELFDRAKNKFANDKNIHLINGDSGEKLEEILRQMNEPALFWLDAHYSGEGTALGNVETPIIKELQTIFSRKNKKDIILIDDARCFNGTHDYPTIYQIQEFVSQYKNLSLKVENDIIMITSR